MRVTLLGFTLPASDMAAIMKVDANMPTQTAAFSTALVTALRSADVDVTLLSAAPVSSYPHNPRIVFGGGAFTHAGASGERLPFINVVAIKHASRFLACLTRGTRALRSWRPDVLLIHGVHSPFLYYGLLARRLLRLRTVVVLTDPPGVVNATDSRLATLLKRLDVRLIRRALRGVDGVVALTEPLATHLAPHRPHLVMEGILAETDAPTPRAPREGGAPFRVMYAGGLLASYGVDRLVDAVGMLGPDAVLLTVYGRGPLAAGIDDRATRGAPVEPVRFAPREEVLRRYAEADVLVQPRPVGQEFVRYSFPSKLLEYMRSGTPVLSTRLPGVPPEYEPYVSWADDDSAEGLARALADLMGETEEARTTRAAAASRFVVERCSPAAQGRRIREFLDGLIPG